MTGRHWRELPPPAPGEPPPTMTRAEFLGFVADTDERWERFFGEPLRMVAGDRAGHNRIKLAIAAEFRAQIRAQGLTCQSIVDGTLFAVGDEHDLIPDVAVVCPPPHPQAVEVTDAHIIVEVASPSNSRAEMMQKSFSYFALKSLAAVLIIDGRRRQGLILRRKVWGTGLDATIIPAAPEPIRLDPPGLTLDLASIWDEAGVPT